jgi:deoxyribonuclease V
MARLEVPTPDLPGLLAELLRQVPRGRVTTCGMLATALGNVVAARWVAEFLAKHEHDAACPCHRVIRAGGVLGAYIAGGTITKRWRLEAEGIVFHDELVDLDRFGFDQFDGPRPLETLRRVQEAIAARLRLCRRSRVPARVGGVDVSYAPDGWGVAAYALVDTSSGELLWTHTVRRRVAFPYITSYLSFRELPLHLELLDEVRRARRLATVVLVDGTGVLHPRHAGIATHLGVVAGVPTVGVTKKLLCGQVDLREMRPLESRPVVMRDTAPEAIGVALRPGSGSRRPLFLSPGHRVDLPFAEQLVRMLLTGHRLPEPLYWADRLSRQAARTHL